MIDALQANGSLSRLSIHRLTKKGLEVFTYRYANQVPLRAGEDALWVNWCEVTVTQGTDGQVLYHNSFATNHQITDSNAPFSSNLEGWQFVTNAPAPYGGPADLQVGCNFGDCKNLIHAEISRSNHNVSQEQKRHHDHT